MKAFYHLNAIDPASIDERTQIMRDTVRGSMLTVARAPLPDDPPEPEPEPLVADAELELDAAPPLSLVSQSDHSSEVVVGEAPPVSVCVTVGVCVFVCETVDVIVSCWSAPPLLVQVYGPVSLPPATVCVAVTVSVTGDPSSLTVTVT